MLKLNNRVKTSRKLLENSPTFQNGFVSNIIYSYASFSPHCLSLAYFKQSCPETGPRSKSVLYYSFLCSILFGWVLEFCAQFVLFAPKVRSNLSPSSPPPRGVCKRFIYPGLDSTSGSTWRLILDSVGEFSSPVTHTCILAKAKLLKGF